VVGIGVGGIRVVGAYVTVGEELGLVEGSHVGWLVGSGTGKHMHGKFAEHSAVVVSSLLKYTAPKSAS
jgi:hypothetical protein